MSPIPWVQLRGIFKHLHFPTMRLTDRIRVAYDYPEDALDPGEIFHDAIGTIFDDDVKDQHGDPDSTILYDSEKYGTLKLKVADPEGTADWRLFSHYLWNAGLKMAVLVGQEDKRFKVGGDQGRENSNGWQWRIQGEKVLELGSGAE